MPVHTIEGALAVPGLLSTIQGVQPGKAELWGPLHRWSVLWGHYHGCEAEDELRTVRVLFCIMSVS